jgi:ankyrin repeat protein
MFILITSVFASHVQDGETALHLAASRGNVECVEVLLEYKASINLVDKVLLRQNTWFEL